MDEEWVAVRADTAAWARDVAAMRAELADGLGDGAARAGRLVEGSLLRAIRTGKLGFDELKDTALRALDQIAAASLRSAVGSVAPGGLGGGLGTVFAGLLGLPGRATGGPVTGGRAYAVGERGPELFVPTTSGRIEAAGAAGPREVRVAITVNARAGEGPAALQASGRQVARAVRRALEG